MSNGYGAYAEGGHHQDEWGPDADLRQPPERPAINPVRALSHGVVTEHWGIVGHRMYAAGPPPPLTDPPPAALYSADPGNGQPYVPWINVDNLGNLYVYGKLVSGPGGTPDWINVKTYGATGNGTTDDTAALQAAINAAIAQASVLSLGGINGPQVNPTVFVPQGNYLISSPLLLQNHQQTFRITGDWGSRIFSNASGIIDFQNFNNQGLEMDHLTLDATGGHVFTNPNLNDCWFHHLQLIQRSPNYAIMNATNASATLSETSFTDIVQYVMADPSLNTRSIAAWNVYTPLGAAVAGLTLDRVHSNNYPGTGGSSQPRDSTQYCFDFACTHAGSSSSWVSNIRFNHCSWNRFFGGCIRVLSGANIGISNCKPDNLATSNGVSWASAAIYIGKHPSNPSVSKGVRIRDYQRGSGALPTPGSEPSDVYIESTTLDVRMDGLTDSSSATPTGPQVQLNGAHNVFISSADSALGVLNQQTDTIVINNGAITLGGTAYTNP